MKTRKNLLISTLCILSLTNIHSNAKSISIENNAFIQSLGGSATDTFSSGIENSKGEIIAIGYTSSSKINGVANNGKDDAMIANYNSDGTLNWVKLFGGSERDKFYDVVLNDDDSFTVVGLSKSTNLGFNNNGDYDAIIAKFDSSGNNLWIKNFGGTLRDEFRSLRKTSDGGYIAIGFSSSTDAGFNNKGESDAIIAKFNESGDIVWSKSFGGDKADELYSISEVSDGYIAVGQSQSTNLDVPNVGYVDAIIVKFDKSGNYVWTKSIAGSAFDSLRSIQPLDDGFIVAGESYSSNAGFSNLGGSGTRDAIIAKYDTQGNQLWLRNFGGSQDDVFSYTINSSNDEYLAIGYSTSSNESFPNRGDKDAFMVKFNDAGDVLRIDTFGGSLKEEIDRGFYTSDGSLLFFGESASTDAGFTNQGGATDALILKYNTIIDEAINAVKKAEATCLISDIDSARKKVNILDESIHKTTLNNRLDSIIPIVDSIPSKNVTSNLDLYIKSENMISLSLNTASINFDNFSGVSDEEQLNAFNVTVNSSLPYELNAYLPSEIQNGDGSKTMEKEILNIRVNGEQDYKTFPQINQKVILKDNNLAGNDINHGIDLKLKGSLAHKADVYKATIKIEVNQK